ncbi:MAG: alpha-L-fucosidase, partial [Lachnospiraceae bacterium]|nr:alpha-L-fucosidase [Lachnospiraceae bacterium]
MFTQTEKKNYLSQIETAIARGPYSDDWASLTSFDPPRWFSPAKFGIFIHWGLY